MKVTSELTLDATAQPGDPASDGPRAAFAEEVSRLRDAKVIGAGGRLRELFDFFVDRGPAAEPATQAEISAHVFGQPEPDADDATVRVYVHRLRKRLEEHYAGIVPAPLVRLQVPAGIYALRFAGDGPIAPAAQEPDHSPPVPPPAHRAGVFGRWLPWAIVLVLVAAFLAGWFLSRAAEEPTNAIWDPLIDSERPVLVVLGDYYIYGEIDPVRPEEGRLIRDFQVNSAADLDRMRDLYPERFSGAEDVGLNYLPFSSAYGLQEIVPLLARRGKEVSLLAASEFRPEMLNRFDIVYVGLLSGMGLLEQLNFRGSGFQLGESYDELVDRGSGRIYVSEEARSLASPAYYRDYAYLARYRAPGDAIVVVIGGSRETGLRSLSAIAAAADLPPKLAEVASEPAFEALFQITGQQGADLSERLLVARPRPGEPR